jgi:Domain of unknown function (DUF5668)
MQEVAPMEEPNKISTQKLVFGLVLVAVGVLAFVDAVDLWNPRVLWKLWPAILILIGVSSEVDALRERRSGGGSLLVGVGVWMLFAVNDILGFTYRSGLPLAILVVGLFVTLHALVDKPEPKKEKNNEPC